MRNLLLLAAVAAAFVFGYWMMKQLDRVLAQISQEQTLPLPSLQIGFSNPLTADSLTEVLERYSRIYPDVSVSLFSGSYDELMKKFSARELDIVFLPETVENPSKTYYDSRRILLHRTPVTTQYGGLSIAPVAEEATLQHVLCANTPYVHCFMAYLQDDTSK